MFKYKRLNIPTSSMLGVLQAFAGDLLKTIKFNK